MEKTAISLYMDGKSSELAKFIKGIKTDEVILIYKLLCIFTWQYFEENYSLSLVLTICYLSCVLLGIGKHEKVTEFGIGQKMRYSQGKGTEMSGKGVV